MLDMITRDNFSLIRSGDAGDYMENFLYVYKNILESPQILLKFDKKKRYSGKIIDFFRKFGYTNNV